MRRVYLDHNATRPVSERVLDAMLPALREDFGNPSSIHRRGAGAREAVESARAALAAGLGARPAEIYFTSGATESINWAIRGALEAKPERKVFVTTAVEHSVVMDVVARLGRRGHVCRVIAVDAEGRLDMAGLEAALDDQVALLSVIGTNNETGVRFDLPAIGALARARGVPLHVDGAQMVGKEEIALADLPVDFLSWSGHKFGAPKGVGGLYVRRGARLRPLIWGGHQERTRRSGTENVPGILGMAEAFSESRAAWDRSESQVRARRDRLESALRARIPELVVNGAGAPRNANTLNVCFPRIEGAAVVLTLSEHGVDCSSGSACSASDPGPSHVLRAMGVSDAVIHGSVRFSLAPETGDDDIGHAIEAVEAAWRHVARVQAL